MQSHFKFECWYRATIVLALLVRASQLTAIAAPPAIAGTRLTETMPTLSIISDLNATNQILTATGLAQSNWVLLTSLVVTQSPYSVIDNTSPPGPQRFYRVVMPNAAASGPPNMALIPAGSFAMGDTFAEGESYELPSAYLLCQRRVHRQIRSHQSTVGPGCRLECHSRL